MITITAVLHLDLPIMVNLVHGLVMEVPMVIGEAAKASGVSAKMLRYYESIGLVPAAVRTEGGYRTYGAREIETLRFIRRARDLGLSVDRIKLLVGLWQDRRRPSRDVKRIALAHVSELRTKIAELTAMCATLEELAAACHGDQRPDCPILRDLAGGGERKPAALAMPAANPVPRAGQTEGMPPTRNHRCGTGE